MTREIFCYSNASKPVKNKQKPKPESPVLYEYVWSVGITGVENVSWCERLDENDSIIVQLIFDTKDSRYSVREMGADLKQLPPFKKKDGVVGWFESIQPVIGAVGKGVQTFGPIAGPMAPVAMTAGSLVSTISETKLNTASTGEFPWWIKTISVKQNPGVEWHISRSYLISVGNRFVGTLVAYFVECNSNETGNNLGNGLKMEIRAFLKRASKLKRAENRNKEILFISHLEQESQDKQKEKDNEGLSPELFNNSKETNSKEREKIVLRIVPH